MSEQDFWRRFSEAEAKKQARKDRVTRLIDWAFRIDMLPDGPGELRVPTFLEAWNGYPRPASPVRDESNSRVIDMGHARSETVVDSDREK